MTNLQQNERIEVSLEVKVTWPGVGSVIGITRYVSDNETLLVADFDEEPEVGTMMLLQLNSSVFGHEAPIIEAVVLQADGQKITFRLLV